MKEDHKDDDDVSPLPNKATTKTVTTDNTPKMTTTTTPVSTKRNMSPSSSPPSPSSSPSPSKKKLEQQKRIIYPENKYIRYWDGMMLILILMYTFTIPYQLFVSGGVHLLLKEGWFVTTVLFNLAFLIDTFLPFVRAYRDPKNGRMVIDPKAIRRNYIQSLLLPNLLSNLPTTVIFYWWGTRQLASVGESGDDNDLDDDDDDAIYKEGSALLLNILKISDIFKLLRLGRASHIISTSDFVREFQEKRNAYMIRMYYFVFLIALAAHWFACIWCGVAYFQVRGFDAVTMLQQDNWIGNWYKGNYEEGGLDPLGWKNDANRYVLSLFWAIQTITSIGYGNIAPFTPIEWWVGSILQLMAGVLWAYIIGGLVGVVTATEVKNEMFRERIDGANRLIRIIVPEETEGTRRRRGCFGGRILRRAGGHNNSNNNEDGDDSKTTDDLAERKRLAKRIRRYLYMQNERPQSAFRYVSNMEDYFPVLETLSPDLQRASTLMIVRRYLESVPYLSSRYLNDREQSTIARRCVIVEFPAEENIIPTLNGDGGGGGGGEWDIIDGDHYGGRRGILLQINGLLWRSSSLCGAMPILSGGAVGAMAVLLEDDDCDSGARVLTLSFSAALFIPRDVVLMALKRNPKAWTDCARWMYFFAKLIRRAQKELIMKQKQEADDGIVTA